MPPELLLLAQICTKSFVGWGFAPDPLAGLRGPTSKGRGEGKGRGPTSKGRGGEEREKKGGDERGKEGKGEREGRNGTEEGPTKNSCRGAQNVKLRH